MAGLKHFLGKTFIVGYGSAPTSSHPGTSLRWVDDVGVSEYSNVKDGQLPEQGTYPLHGNGKSQADIFETTSRPPRPLSRMSTTSSRFGGQSGLPPAAAASISSRPASIASSSAGRASSGHEARPDSTAGPTPILYSNTNRPETGYSDAVSMNSTQHSNAGDFSNVVQAHGTSNRRGSFSSGYNEAIEGTAPTVGTYPLRGNSMASFPLTPKAPKSTTYEKLREGKAPRIGTLPLHGNPQSDVQRSRSKAQRDREERGRSGSRPTSAYSQFSQSAISRSGSGARVPRRSHSGARYAAGDPTNRRSISISSASQVGNDRDSTVVHDSNTYTDLSDPNIPPIEDNQMPVTRPKLEGRVQSSGGDSARTPIAEEFSSKSWYTRSEPDQKHDPAKVAVVEKNKKRDSMDLSATTTTEPVNPPQPPKKPQSTQQPETDPAIPIEQAKTSEQPIVETTVTTPEPLKHHAGSVAIVPVPGEPLVNSEKMVLGQPESSTAPIVPPSSQSSNSLERVSTVDARDFVYVAASSGIVPTDIPVVEVRNKRGSIRYSLGKTFIPGYDERNVKRTKADREVLKAKQLEDKAKGQSQPQPITTRFPTGGDRDDGTMLPSNPDDTMTPVNTRITEGSESLDAVADLNASPIPRDNQSKSQSQDKVASASGSGRRNSLRIGLQKIFMPYLFDDDVASLPSNGNTLPAKETPSNFASTSQPASETASSSNSNNIKEKEIAPASSSTSSQQPKSRTSARSSIAGNPEYFALPRVDESLMRRHTSRQNRISSGEIPASPMEYTPNGEGSSSPNGEGRQRRKPEIRPGKQQVYTQPIVARGTDTAPSLKGVVNLNNTFETHYDRKIAKAVYHDTIRPVVHHVRQEQITREIHTHDVHHRVQPIVDVQVLPTRHFVDDGASGYKEMPANNISGRAIDAHNNQNWVVAETVSGHASGEGHTDETGTDKPAQETIHSGANKIMSGIVKDFTARTFDGKEGDYEEWTDEDGVRHTRTTWVHPPRLATGAMNAGQTEPMEFGQKQHPTSTTNEKAIVERGTPGIQNNTLEADLHNKLSLKN